MNRAQWICWHLLFYTSISNLTFRIKSYGVAAAARLLAARSLIKNLSCTF